MSSFDTVSVNVSLDSPQGGSISMPSASSPLRSPPARSSTSPLKSSAVAPSGSPGSPSRSPAGSYQRFGNTLTSAASVNYEAEEEPFNPKRLECCDRCDAESSCKNMNFSVWTTLGRLEWADAFGRGGSGCGCRATRLRPLSPGTMRLLRPLLFLALLAIVVADGILTWGDGLWPMYFTTWINVVATVYMLCASILCFWLHRHDYVPTSITLLGRVTWFLNVLSLATTVGVSLGFWLTNGLFADLNPQLIDYFRHGATAVIMLFDLYIGAQPFFLMHVIYTALFTSSWLFWSIFQYVLKIPPANKPGATYIYAFINWANPLQSFGVAVAILAWIILNYIVIWILSRGRDVPYKHYEKTLHL